MKHIIAISVIISLFTFACYYDSEESLYPEENLGNCDTVNVTYYKSIVPLLENNCLSCHSSATNADQGGGHNLQGYANIYEHRDLALAAMNHTGDIPMPNNSAKLKDCLIQQFQKWIDQGAPEN